MIVDLIVHWVGQAFYGGLEFVDWVIGRSNSRLETRAIRRAHHSYYVARELRRRGKLSAAMSAAQDSFAALNEADQTKTFAVMGAPVVILMAQIASEANRVQDVLPNLVSALGVFREIQAEPDRRSDAIDKLIEWLSHYVERSPH